VIARRPARVQVSYLGYLNTTGLAAMDWRITDSVADPPGSAECYYTERLAYLPACQWLFTPPEEAPACTAPPSEQNGYVTLGAAHNFAKMTPAVLELWSGAAAAVPQCRIALMGVPEGSARARVTGAFARAGIGADRITCSAGMPRPDYYRFLSSLDVALDTFPYAGGTTTCDALWMGVPVVSLAGRHGASRSGASLLSATGLAQCVAGSHEEYVSICARLCADLTGLASMRTSMRERMAASPLMDVRGFVRGLEGLYRAMAQR
jgi:predicted O-linked N-acetylglucosamine transferase (SPINDLY family)